MSILVHPIWSRLAPHLVVVKGDTVRAAFERMPLDLADEVRLLLAPCLHCGRPLFPIRIRPQIGYQPDGRGDLYSMSGDYHPACSPEIRPACSISLRVHHELGKLAMSAHQPQVDLRTRIAGDS
jgi:hypothetical protein